MVQLNLSIAAKEARSAYQKKWRHKNREKWIAYQREWKRKNPEKVKKHFQDYWERKAAHKDNIKSRILGLHNRGLSLRQIAAEVGINHMKVSRILKKI